MASSSVTLVYTLCVLRCICSLQTVVMESLHLQYYTHETRGGPDNTLLISGGRNFSSLEWGSFVIFDNIIKEGLSSDSTVLGEVTGTTVMTSKPGGSIQFIAEMLFNENYKYNGSSFLVLPGRIIPGGTGYFRGYSGYGQVVEVTTTTPPDRGLHVYLWDIYLESKCTCGTSTLESM